MVGTTARTKGSLTSLRDCVSCRTFEQVELNIIPDIGSTAVVGTRLSQSRVPR